MTGQSNETHFASGAPFRLDFLLLLHLRLLDHPEQRVTSSLQLLRVPTFTKPVEPEDRELRDILLYAFVHVISSHPVVIETTVLIVTRN